MQIKKHDISHMVELRDGSTWRIWPSDIPKTLQWLSTTEIGVTDIDDEICSHAISANENWPSTYTRCIVRCSLLARTNVATISPRRTRVGRRRPYQLAPLPVTVIASAKEKPRGYCAGL